MPSARPKKILFRCLALCSPLLLLCALEVILRLAGYGYATGFFLKTTIDGREMLVQNDRFGWRFFGPSLARTPRPMLLPARKDPGTLRVVVFGESAAYGDPKPDFGLPRLLRVLLQDAFPDRNVEVINAAMTGINSHVILPIARDVAALDADAWVLYMGNNEVVGPFGSGTVFGPAAPPMSFIRATLALKSTRVGQLIAAAVGSSRKPESDQAEWRMQLFTGAQVAQHDPRMRNVYSHFTRNLSDILATARRKGVPVVLGTVASNLKDCAPFGSLHRPDLSAEQKRECERFFEEARKARSAGLLPLAIQQFEAAAGIDGGFAQLQFDWADSELASGHREQALRHFTLARDCDTLRFRADSRLNQIVRDTARAHGNQVRLADCEAALSRESPSGITGEEFLYEHVHFNFSGNYRAACCLAEQLISALGSRSSIASGHAWLSREQCASRLAWTSVEECRALKSVMLRLADPPFTCQANHVVTRQRLQNQIERLLPSLKPEGLRAAAQTCSNAVLLQPRDWVLHKNYGDLLLKLSDTAGARACYNEVVRLLPHDPLARMQLGLIELQAKQPVQAVQQFQSALRMQPRSVPILNSLAIAFTALHQPEAAMESYRLALALKPLSSETHLNLALALESRDQKEQALSHLRQALLHPLETPDFRVRLGKTAAAHGWLDAAITNFSRAVELDPVDSAAHFYLATALLQSGEHSRALGPFSEAVRLDPDSAQKRVGLGMALLKCGRNAEAVEPLAKAALLEPNLVDARLNLAIALLRLGQASEARMNFEKVLQLDPANPVAKNLITQVQSPDSARPSGF